MSDSPVFVTAAEASPGIEHARAAGIGTPLLCEIIARNSFGGTIDVVAVAREAYDAGARGIGAAPVADDGGDIDDMEVRNG